MRPWIAYLMSYEVAYKDFLSWFDRQCKYLDSEAEKALDKGDKERLYRIELEKSIYNKIKRTFESEYREAISTANYENKE